MALPITIPYTFANATTSIPLSQLDSDFATVASAINGIGNGTNILSNIGNSTVTTTGGSAARTLANRFADTINVLDFGVVADGSTDNKTAIQAILDAYPMANIFFPPGSYNSSGPIFLSNATGPYGSSRHFQGTINGYGATITFTNSGSSSDSDVNMQRGFIAFPRVNGSNGDTTGVTQIVLQGLSFSGPTHGVPLYFANSQNVELYNLKTNNSRYGVVTECCISFLFDKCNFQGYTNAGVGLLMLSDTTNVWYGSATPSSSYWNDVPTFLSNGFASTVSGGLAHILDHGSEAESARTVIGGYFYSGSSGQNVYGIVCRNGQWQISNAFFENVNYPVRILDSNAAENPSGTTNLTGVTAAEPSGTYAISNFVDGYSYYFTVTNTYTSKSVIDYNLNGVTGYSFVGQNISQQSSGYFIQSLYAANSIIVDLGNSWIGATGSYKNITYAKYFPATNLQPLTSGSTLGNYANDAAAAAGGVAVNGFYRNGSVLQVRVS
jgi:hypothetical protein